MSVRTTGQAILALTISSAAFGSACSEAFSGDSNATGGDVAQAGSSSGAGSAVGGDSSAAGGDPAQAGSSSGGSSSVGGEASEAGAPGSSDTDPACRTAPDCPASSCSDDVKNGSETGVDCGGTCPLKCALEQGCAATSDCAVAAGDAAESVRCMANVCVSTKPPSAGGPPMFWQDFRPERLQANAESCSAPDKTCLMANGSFYPMGGIGPGGVGKPLTKALLFTTEGVVGGGGKFDGYTCLTRPGTDLSLANLGAFTAMAWVKPTRVTAPWESVIIGALDHYFIAVDTNMASQRFLTAVATAQSTSFDYRSSETTGELPNGAWHHVAATYNTSAGKLLQYVDAKLVHSTALTGNVTSGAVNAYLGCRKDTAVSYFYQGTLDEIVVYRRALAAEELADYVERTSPP